MGRPFFYRVRSKTKTFLLVVWETNWLLIKCNQPTFHPQINTFYTISTLDWGVSSTWILIFCCPVYRLYMLHMEMISHGTLRRCWLLFSCSRSCKPPKNIHWNNSVCFLCDGCLTRFAYRVRCCLFDFTTILEIAPKKKWSENNDFRVLSVPILVIRLLLECSGVGRVYNYDWEGCSILIDPIGLPVNSKCFHIHKRRKKDE